MKNLLIVCLIVAGIYNQAFAGPTSGIAYVSQGKTVTVRFNPSLSSPVKVVLRDLSDFTLHSETVNTSNIRSRKYNLRNLPDGDYIFEVHEPMKIVEKKIRVQGRAIQMIDETIYFKPSTFLKGNTLGVNVLALNKDVKVRIYDADGNTVYSAEMKSEPYVAQLYNLEKMDRGDYLVNISIDNHLFSESFSLN